MDSERSKFVPSGMKSPLVDDDKSHRLLLRERMQAWMTERGKKQGDLYNLILNRFREEQGNPKAELPVKIETLRAFLSRPEKQRFGGMMNVAYRAIDESGAWDPASRSAALTSGNPDHLFHSFNDFLAVKELTSVALLRRLPGVYRVYRPIVTHPGCFVMGYVACRHDESTGVLSYREYNRTQRKHGREEKELILRGYAFKKSAMIYLISTDNRRNSFHLTILTNQEKNSDDHYSVLAGGFLDTIGNQAYSGRVIMERIPDVSPSDAEALTELEDQADVQTADEIPPSILTFFRGDVHGDVRIF